MSPTAERLQAIHERISRALGGVVRPVTVVAVSKTKPAAAVREAWAAGQRDFGENYVQEALAKMAELEGLDLTWHYIGVLQGNKARDVAERFDWCHGVDRLRIAQLLSRHRPAGLAPLNVCIQVNISAEATKGGVAPGETLALARDVAALPGLKLRGLMGMASPSGDTALARAEFSRLRAEFEQVRAAGIALDTLSMGMTQDFEAALAEGSTMLRLGTALFGSREKAAA